MLVKTITDQLKQEHRVLEGLAERKEVRGMVVRVLMVGWRV